MSGRRIFHHLYNGTSSFKMARIYLLCLLLLTGLIHSGPGFDALAQEPSATTGVQSVPERLQEDSTVNPVDRIVEECGGKVEIIISEDLLEKILKSPSAHKKSTGPAKPSIRPGINRLSGYRIQVFADGRNQHSLEARAKARGAAISSRFPKYRGQVYTFSSSPNWYTRVGNFRSQTEANDALRELKGAFPSFASEMRVVKCQIVVIR